MDELNIKQAHDYSKVIKKHCVRQSMGLPSATYAYIVWKYGSSIQSVMPMHCVNAINEGYP